MMNKSWGMVIMVCSLLMAGCSLSPKTNSGTPAQVPTKVPEAIVGNDRDEHGCIGSAGYSWCPNKAKCLRIWEEPCEESPTEPTADETVTIKTQIKEAIVAKRGSGANNLEITISKIEGDWAKGGAAVVGEGGGMWFGAKVNGEWKLVWDGNGIIECTDLEAYPEFSTTMIPECYNSNTSKMVKR